LTPQFAAPEQFLGKPVTTATDVYSLGLTLYLLLTGRHAFATHQAALSDEAAPASSVCEVPTIARRSLEGDLDNILATAMSKTRAGRSVTVAAFAADLRRSLASEPVKARADTAAYRLSKFVQRHRGSIASGVLTVLALCVLTVTALLQKVEADRQRDAAEFQ